MKFRKLAVLTALSALIYPCTVSASGYVLRLTSTTYAYNSENGPFSYTGTVSVLGTDRIKEGSTIYYPTYVEITYDVQGKIYSARVNSLGPNDSTQRFKYVTCNDRWNNGPKTKVSPKYGRASVNTRPSQNVDVQEETEGSAK